MIDLFSARKIKKNVSFKYLLLTFFVCISMAAWLGISDLRADENDPEPNSDEFEEGFQNITQEQRAAKLADAAASQDLDSEKDEKFFTEQIREMRESGMGWGAIVHKLNADYQLNLHPSILGLGHFSKSPKAVYSSKHSSVQSGNNQGQGFAWGHSKDNISNLDGGNAGGNGGGRGGGNGGGKK